MRVFLSAYSGFTLAVPMNAVAAMMLYDKKPEKVIHYDQESRNTYISLPRLFKLDEEIHHGIILREWNSTANKVVLLTAEIKRDIEIPDNEFHPIPKSFGALRFSKIFSNIKFSDNPILLLDIKQLTQLLQDKQQAINEESSYTKPPPPVEQPLVEEPPMEKLPPEEPPLAEQPPPKEPPTEQPSLEQPPPEKLPPEQPLPEQPKEPPLAEQPLPEEPLPMAASEIEPLEDQLLLEELPEEEPPEELLIEEEPEELLVEEQQEDSLVEEEPEEFLAAAASELEPLTDRLVLSELP